METVLYIDVLFLMEWAMDATLLFLTGCLVRNRQNVWKYVVGGAVQSLCHVGYMLYFHTLETNTPMMIVVFVAVMWWLFRPKSIKSVAYLMLATLTSSFFLSGCIQLFLTFYTKPIPVGFGGAIKANWVPWQLLLWSILASYLMVRLGRNWLEIHLTKRMEYATIAIEYNGKTTSFVALIDTGNTLEQDGKGVILVEAPRIFSVLDLEQIQSFLLTTEKKGFVPVSYKSLGNAEGILYGIYIEKCVITTDTKKIILQNRYIGIGEDRFTGGYEGLVPACLLEEEGK